jgi:hypothetical protein
MTTRNLIDADLDALISFDRGDSYYVTLPDGSTQGIGYTAEAWSEPADRRAAARRVLARWHDANPGPEAA